MKKNDLTLWFGNRGTRLDKFGNVYSVDGNEHDDEETTNPDIVSFYQSLLKEIGLTVTVEEYETFNPDPWKRSKKCVVHTVDGVPSRLPIRRRFGYMKG